jgi:ABC-type phosphate transport system auxiliary subunit
MINRISMSSVGQNYQQRTKAVSFKSLEGVLQREVPVIKKGLPEKVRFLEAEVLSLQAEILKLREEKSELASKISENEKATALLFSELEKKFTEKLSSLRQDLERNLTRHENASDGGSSIHNYVHAPGYRG